MHLKLLQKATQNWSWATCDLIVNKIADKITRTSNVLRKNNWKSNEERFISSELRQQVTDDLRLKEENYWLF